ncbi:MAG: ATP-dependent helicase [Candidatus Cloacimonetes bacterium]|nr:ATP-dependent helicase [Candidatus Cloacimonadota bacterium]
MCDRTDNPAEAASKVTLEKVFTAIDDRTNFRLEAGAGAGKTYSLIEALKYLINKSYNDFISKDMKIACITYTNVAKNEINDRTDNNPIVLAETIHAFSWSLIKHFQKQMLLLIPELTEKWKTRIEEFGGISNQKVDYDLGYPAISETTITLHHDDVIRLMTKLLGYQKFKDILRNKYPVIFIDEYQDTNIDLAEAIVTNLIESDEHVLIGLFGDHWQKIYGNVACGLIKSPSGKLIEIGKEANFRSDKNIVQLLNRMRPELPQNEKDPDSEGIIIAFHSNSWQGERMQGSHWKGDLPSLVVNEYLEKVKAHLNDEGWDISSYNTKILMLTNNLIATQQGYKDLASCFRDNDDYLKLGDPYLKFFKEVLEPLNQAFIDEKYGDLFEIVGRGSFLFKKQGDKAQWNNDLKRVSQLRLTGTIGEIIRLLKETRKPRLSPKVEEYEELFAKFDSFDENKKDKHRERFNRINKLKDIPYKEVIDLSRYIDDKTPFSTNHGVKGAQFENVIIVCGRGWNQYNWNQMLEWFDGNYPSERFDSFERNRNLFYVGCSRAKKRLAVIFTQELSTSALAQLERIFLPDNIYSLSDLD